MKEQISKVSEFTYHIDVIIYLWSVPKLSRYQVMDMKFPEISLLKY